MEIGVRHLLEASVKLECSMETTARALVLYHHFMRCIDEVKYDDSMVSATALFLSSRLNEQVIDHDTLLITFYCIVNKTSRVLQVEDPEFTLLKRSLITLDYVMQRMLNFDLNHKLAHQYLVPYLHTLFARSLKISECSGEITDTCIRLISDCYVNKMCLNYQADHITIACIDATLFIYGLLEDMEMIQPWYKGFCNDLDEKKVKEIQDNMFSLYNTEVEEISPKDMENIISASTGIVTS